MGSIPTVDMSIWYKGNVTSRVAVAAAFDATAKSVGFVQLSNHGIPEEVLSSLLSAADDFFALPMEEKLQSVAPSRASNRGYSPPRSESLALSLSSSDPSQPRPPPDLFEAFNVGPDDVDYSDPFYAAERHRFFSPNVWPARPAALRPAANAYLREARRLALTLSDILSLAVGLPESFLYPILDRSTTTLRLNHYAPPSADDGDDDDDDDAGLEEGQMRMGAHTDYGVLTLLYADSVPGLEVYTTSGEWVSVVPERGNLICNLGDMAAELTNDRWKSTLHRVVPGKTRRRSIAFFFDANYDAVIECLPTCHDDSNPPKYPAVIAGNHLQAKILGPRTMTRTTAMNTARDRDAHT